MALINIWYIVVLLNHVFRPPVVAIWHLLVFLKSSEVFLQNGLIRLILADTQNEVLNDWDGCFVVWIIFPWGNYHNYTLCYEIPSR